MFSVQKQNNDAFREKLTYNQSCLEFDIAKIKTNPEEFSADDALECLMNLEVTVFQINSLARKTLEDRNFLLHYSQFEKTCENHCKELLNEKGIAEHIHFNDVKIICQELISKPSWYEITDIIAELEEQSLKIQAFQKSHKNISLNRLDKEISSLKDRCKKVACDYEKKKNYPIETKTILPRREDISFEAYFKFDEAKEICKELLKATTPDRAQITYMIVDLEETNLKIQELKQLRKELNIPLERLSKEVLSLRDRCKKVTDFENNINKNCFEKQFKTTLPTKRDTSRAVRGDTSPAVARRAEKR